MTQIESMPTLAPIPSPSRLRHVRTRLEADADAVLREIAYVLKLTQQVRDEILNDRPEFPHSAG